MQQKKHVGVYALVVKDENILLIKKARGCYIGMWDLPGGKLEFGEKPLEGLAREVMEETGLVVKESDLLNVLTHVIVCDSTAGEKEELYHIGIIYSVIVDSDDNLKTGADGEDSDGASWVKISDVNEINFTPFVNQSLKNYLKRL